MPPEQILDYCYVKPAGDVYSLGMCWYYLLTGKSPYRFPSPLEIQEGVAPPKDLPHAMALALEDRPIPLFRQNPKLSKSLAAVVDKCLNKRPDERFPDGDQLREALAECRMQNEE
ncbi:MAG: hypothetical protein V2A61_01645 [Calditrichota bacterium]